MYYIYLAWYFKWTNWTEADYNTCLGCKPGYYLQFGQWKEAWDESYFANTVAQIWEACHSYWSQWKDSTQFNWQQWISGYFYFNNGWYETWPDGYYGDKTTYTCQLWNIGWTKWFGPSLKEWIEWNSALLYIKSGATECSIATCIRGYYLNHTDLNCYSWDKGWNLCEFPNNHDCIQCNSIYLMTSPGQCTYWNDVTGYSINSFGICQEICGDGLNLGEFQWDDGNLVNGDGCSNTCLLEVGYTCKGTFWWEIVPPKASIISVSTKNLLTVRFSEPVKFKNYTLMSQNLKANINGPSSPYIFDYAIENSNGALQANKSFTQMIVQISNIQVSIFGGGIEKIELWFEDRSVVQDLANNSMSPGKIVGNLNYFEYIAPGKN